MRNFLFTLVVAYFGLSAQAFAAPVIDNAGYGCDDGYCVWIVGRGYSANVHVEIRTGNDGEVLAVVPTKDLSYSPTNLAFGLSAPELRQAFKDTGVKVYLVDGPLRSNSKFVKWGEVAPQEPANPPAISNAGYGCADGYCIWIQGSGFTEDVSVELRTADDKGLVSTYSGKDRSYNGDSVTLGLATAAEKNLFATTGLMVHLIEKGLKSNGLLVKHGAVTTPPPPPTPTRELYYTYFGVSADSHLETADHTNMVMVASWGDWNSAQGRKDLTNMNIRQLKESRERGVKWAMMTVDYLVYTKNYQFRGTGELREALNEFKKAGVLDMVVALYPVDEPDDHGMSSQTVTNTNNEIRAVMSEFSELKNAKLAVFYTDHGNWPGIASYDWVGYDSYGSGPTKPPISGNQKIMLIPGGSSPWKEGPERFYDAAMADSRVVMIMPFVWFDGGNSGIRSNGMAARYRSVGCKITQRCSP